LEANLTDANLSDTDLIGTNLKGANLEGVNLDGADLESADLRALLLFDVDSKEFQSDLDKGTISEDLRKKFKDYLIDLSENTGISVMEKGRMWLIDDKNSEQTYVIRKEEQLNIYKRTKFDFNGIKRANNWDKATFDVDIWEKLSSQRD